MEAMEGLIHAVERGDILEERIDQSLDRILALKERFLLPGEDAPTDPKEMKKQIGCDRHRAIVKEIEQGAASRKGI